MPLFPVRRKFTNVPAHIEHLRRHETRSVIVMDLKITAIELRHTETKYRVCARTNLHGLRT